jgi:hypothetical protein
MRREHLFGLKISMSRSGKLVGDLETTSDQEQGYLDRN